MRRATQWIIGATISLVALALAFRSADLAQVGQALRDANYFYLLPVAGLILLGLAARAFSWQSILGYQVPFGRVFSAMNEGYLLNNLVPFRLGELARAYLVSRSQRIPAARVLSSVVVERVIDLCMLVGISAGLLPIVAGLSWARGAALLSGLMGLLAALGLVAAEAQRARVLRLAHWGLAHLKWLNSARWEARLVAFLDGLAGLRDWRRFLAAVLGSAAAWAVTGLASWLALAAVTPQARLEAGFFALLVTGLGVAVPSAPGSLGVWEAASVLALSAFGIPGSTALSYAILFHLANLGLTSLFGALALAREGETIGHLAQAAQALVSAGQAPQPAVPVDQLPTPE